MRLIDADRLNAVVNETLETLVMLPVFSLQEVHLKTAFQTLTDMINNAPTIDAVPVVKCKDCVHLEILNGSTYYAKCRWNGRLFERFGRADTRKWYCADGEREGE